MILDRSEIHLVETGATLPAGTYVKLGVVDSPVTVVVRASGMATALNGMSHDEVVRLIRDIAGRLYLAPKGQCPMTSSRP